MEIAPLRAIPGLPGPVARIALGTANLSVARRDAAFELLDAFVELGGTLIDTAMRYGNGESESVIGDWLRSRPEAARRVSILTKGAHPDEQWRSRMTPEVIAADASASLERLGVDHVALYLVHRDDTDVPAGEIIDALDEHVRTGRAARVGVSNWTVPRLREAVEWAAANHRPPIAISSSFLALAEPTAFPWAGCVSARDEATLAWHADSGVPLLAWSSQAAGFFADGFDPARSPEAASTYDTSANRERRDRARELGRERGKSAAQIALAWVLGEPSAPIAVAGARTPAALADAFESLHMPLTPAERRWLATGTSDR
jgi:1-deoxyxylulose-5-phosphate synthase